MVISSAVGVGILTTPGLIAQMAPAPVALLGLWLAGGGLVFADALAYAQLRALRRRAGGEYIYPQDASGKFFTYLHERTSLGAEFSRAIAAGAVAPTPYAHRFPPVVADSQKQHSFLMSKRLAFTSLTIVLWVLMPWAALFAQPHSPTTVYLTYNDAQPVLEALSEVLPQELKGKSADQQAANWSQWVRRQDQEIRSRLFQGDEDSMINFLLFGSSFTKQPRLTTEHLAELQAKERPGGSDGGSALSAEVGQVVLARTTDLIAALAAPGHNERLLFLHHLVTRKGFHPEGSPAERGRLKAYILENLRRVLNEQASYAKALEAARALTDRSAEFAERSKLYHARGLSLDTTLRPNLAVEESLLEMKQRKLLTPLSIHRVAIIGPGLDFTDKQDGYDFYPQQTIQPFALMDSLLRLGLAKAGSIHVTTMDISPRVNDHLKRARQRARRSTSYVAELPHDRTSEWKPETVRYWERFGDQLGKPVPPVRIPSQERDLQLRAVRIEPRFVLKILPADLNIVLQHLELAPEQQFDLIVATNIFIYYDVFEQSLALVNVGKMLRPGGFLLSNNALLELPSSEIHSVGYHTTVYSNRPDDGDHIVWYRLSKE